MSSLRPAPLSASAPLPSSGPTPMRPSKVVIQVGGRKMQVLGKARARPVELPSIRAENQGLDPNVKLVPESGGWASKKEPAPGPAAATALAAPAPAPAAEDQRPAPMGSPSTARSAGRSGSSQSAPLPVTKAPVLPKAAWSVDKGDMDFSKGPIFEDEPASKTTSWAEEMEQEQAAPARPAAAAAAVKHDAPPSGGSSANSVNAAPRPGSTSGSAHAAATTAATTVATTTTAAASAESHASHGAKSEPRQHVSPWASRGSASEPAVKRADVNGDRGEQGAHPHPPHADDAARPPANGGRIYDWRDTQERDRDRGRGERVETHYYPPRRGAGGGGGGESQGHGSNASSAVIVPVVLQRGDRPERVLAGDAPRGMPDRNAEGRPESAVEPHHPNPQQQHPQQQQHVGREPRTAHRSPDRGTGLLDLPEGAARLDAQRRNGSSTQAQRSIADRPASDGADNWRSSRSSSTDTGAGSGTTSNPSAGIGGAVQHGMSQPSGSALSSSSSANTASSSPLSSSAHPAGAPSHNSPDQQGSHPTLLHRQPASTKSAPATCATSNVAIPPNSASAPPPPMASGTGAVTPLVHERPSQHQSHPRDLQPHPPALLQHKQQPHAQPHAQHHALVSPASLSENWRNHPPPPAPVAAPAQASEPRAVAQSSRVASGGATNHASGTSSLTSTASSTSSSSSASLNTATGNMVSNGTGSGGAAQATPRAMGRGNYRQRKLAQQGGVEPVPNVRLPSRSTESITALEKRETASALSSTTSSPSSSFSSTAANALSATASPLSSSLPSGALIVGTSAGVAVVAQPSDASVSSHTQPSTSSVLLMGTPNVSTAHQSSHRPAPLTMPPLLSVASVAVPSDNSASFPPSPFSSSASPSLSSITITTSASAQQPRVVSVIDRRRKSSSSSSLPVAGGEGARQVRGNSRSAKGSPAVAVASTIPVGGADEPDVSSPTSNRDTQPSDGVAADTQSPLASPVESSSTSDTSAATQGYESLRGGRSRRGRGVNTGSSGGLGRGSLTALPVAASAVRSVTLAELSAAAAAAASVSAPPVESFVSAPVVAPAPAPAPESIPSPPVSVSTSASAFPPTSATLSTTSTTAYSVLPANTDNVNVASASPPQRMPSAGKISSSYLNSSYLNSSSSAPPSSALGAPGVSAAPPLPASISLALSNLALSQAQPQFLPNSLPAAPYSTATASVASASLSSSAPAAPTFPAAIPHPASSPAAALPTSASADAQPAPVSSGAAYPNIPLPTSAMPTVAAASSASLPVARVSTSPGSAGESTSSLSTSAPTTTSSAVLGTSAESAPPSSDSALLSSTPAFVPAASISSSSPHGSAPITPHQMGGRPPMGAYPPGTVFPDTWSPLLPGKPYRPDAPYRSMSDGSVPPGAPIGYPMESPAAVYTDSFGRQLSQPAAASYPMGPPEGTPYAPMVGAVPPYGNAGYPSAAYYPHYVQTPSGMPLTYYQPHPAGPGRAPVHQPMAVVYVPPGYPHPPAQSAGVPAMYAHRYAAYPPAPHHAAMGLPPPDPYGQGMRGRGPRGPRGGYPGHG